MAQWLVRLLAQGEKVMWVGGMAHWTRIIARIAEGDFDSPGVNVIAHSAFHRMRMAPSALHRMTGRLPWFTACYAQDPSVYDEHSAMQELCLEATKESDQESVVLVLSTQSNNSLNTANEDETAVPIDVARTLQYARNLSCDGGTPRAT